MTERQDKRTTVVILNYFKAKRVIEGLASQRRQTIADRLDIVVVDNSVDDEQARILRAGVMDGETLIVTTDNVGYSRGINNGVAARPPADYVLLANPDIVVDDADTIERLIAEMEARPKIGILSPMQVNDDGSLVEVARRFPTLFHQFARRIAPASRQEHSLLKPLHVEASIAVDWVQSSFVLVRGDFWRRIGGLDEHYFVFMSDVELCHRARQEKLDVVVSAAAKVRADGLRASSGGPMSVFRNKVVRIHLRDAIVYHLRHGTLFGSP